MFRYKECRSFKNSYERKENFDTCLKNAEKFLKKQKEISSVNIRKTFGYPEDGRPIADINVELCFKSEERPKVIEEKDKTDLEENIKKKKILNKITIYQTFFNNAMNGCLNSSSK
jgi:hexokinase